MSEMRDERGWRSSPFVPTVAKASRAVAGLASEQRQTARRPHSRLACTASTRAGRLAERFALAIADAGRSAVLDGSQRRQCGLWSAVLVGRTFRPEYAWLGTRCPHAATR